jgi:hypothetical protein
MSSRKSSERRLATMDGSDRIASHRHKRRMSDPAAPLQTPSGHTGWGERYAERHGGRRNDHGVLCRRSSCSSGRTEIFAPAWTTWSWMTSPRRIASRYQRSTTIWIRLPDMKSGDWQVVMHPDDRDDSVLHRSRAMEVYSYALRPLQRSGNVRTANSVRPVSPHEF